jgi:hypothetical protein
MNILCVKWGTKYSADYVNNLYNMVKRNADSHFDFYCYTDDASSINKDIRIIPIQSDLTSWWLKLDLLTLFNAGDNIILDLDIVVLNRLERLWSVKTRTLSVLYSQWKEGFITPTNSFSTLYNSSIMKWNGMQGQEVAEFFNKHRDKMLFKYKGIDRMLFQEQIQVDLLPTSIAYSYWKGVRYGKDTTPEKLRNDYEICIVNHSPKPHEITNSWIHDYWR